MIHDSIDQIFSPLTLIIVTPGKTAFMLNKKEVSNNSQVDKFAEALATDSTNATTMAHLWN